MTESFVSNSLDDLLALAGKLVKAFGTYKIIAFKGEIGAGKTTLIAAICKHLGVHGNISSPTYSLVNEYKSNTGTIYHFDFYRLQNEQEAADMGLYEYLDSGHLCLIEWPEKVAGMLLEEQVLTVTISVLSDSSRQILIDEN
ncbi:MAG: tRNA (adenosine(37)-N6)-threonylcarbamoyltransferase complex ATPase subunit type 1 TsaE [Flavobacteriaceae bacterium]|nr:tRNA (adenosine(37)-N6)-threonylcarbamoyltransferase complex ATPase subunit type 1 TsaE [Flavobacteriaceae bacterium]